MPRAPRPRQRAVPRRAAPRIRSDRGHLVRRAVEHEARDRRDRAGGEHASATRAPCDRPTSVGARQIRDGEQTSRGPRRRGRAMAVRQAEAAPVVADDAQPRAPRGDLRVPDLEVERPAVDRGAAAIPRLRRGIAAARRRLRGSRPRRSAHPAHAFSDIEKKFAFRLRVPRGRQARRAAARRAAAMLDRGPSALRAQRETGHARSSAEIRGSPPAASRGARARAWSW